jgi:hypothetical protein
MGYCQKEGDMKVISGGQTGADQGGLEAGKILGLETGGTAPPGWVTEKGSDYSLRDFYGLVEGENDPSIYPKRTAKNIRDSDGTVVFGDVSERGTALTLRRCSEYRKPYIVCPNTTEFHEWIKAYDIRTLNVAGNRESKHIGIQQVVCDFLVNALGSELIQ